MDNDWKYLHGRLDPGNEATVNLIEFISPKELPKDESYHGKKMLDSTDEPGSSSSWSAQVVTTSSFGGKSLLALPSEIIDHILRYLGPIDLVSVSRTCRLLNSHGKSDLPWQRLVQENVPGVQLASPAPARTFRELYIAHDPHWFLTKYKVWFSDYFLTGKIIIVRYDPRRGCIEGYRLVAERPPPTFDPWDFDDEVLIHSFEPKARLHLDQPVLQIDAELPQPNEDPSGKGKGRPRGPNPPRFGSEISMPIHERSHYGVRSNFFHARRVPEMPNMSLWPPPTIPARHRVRNESQQSFSGSGHRPQSRAEVSDQTFRIRRWMDMAAGQPVPGVHLGEEVYTYATLDPKLYAPTEDKPYRGIWIGDYSGHGCEFLLMHQPDDEEPFDPASVIQEPDETPEEFEKRKHDERIYRGSIRAIKLTGDPNVPRGEYTFVSDDIGKKGFVRWATEERFKGARVVKSRGHIASTMFRDDKYIESQLIMISPNRLAQFWVGFGHISFFERVNIDDFLSP
ncbi:F-box domain-containing protein [Xylogone sp. PMI_703]|nr:F-box domain-containing protein [Xylogone sp. PMI_703]